MARLTARRRKGLPASKFALPKQRKYPVDTPRRAANAKGRAVQQFKKGNLSRSAERQVIRRANAALKRFHRKM